MDNYAEYMVKKRPDSRDNFKKAVILVLLLLFCAASILFVIFTGFTFILLITCALIFGAYFLFSGLSVEYEYAVTNGEMDVDKIIARRKRVHLITVEASKFEAFGPMTDSVSDEADRTLVLCSDNTGEGEYYADLVTEEYGATRILFSPNEAVAAALEAALPRQLRYRRNQA